MKIPLPGLMRKWREQDYDEGGPSLLNKAGLAFWAALARRPMLYHAATRIAVPMLATLSRGKGAFSWLPMAGGWTKHRNLPAPQSRTFQALWADHKAGLPRC